TYFFCLLTFNVLAGTCQAQGTADPIDLYRETILQQSRQIEQLELDLLELQVQQYKELYERKQKMLADLQKLRKWAVRLEKIANGCCDTRQSRHHLAEMVKDIKKETEELLKSYRQIKKQIEALKQAIRNRAIGGEG
ncbi:MAG: hypothetical protein D6730_10255, partial [Bacteroidetes bacterium]